MTKNIPLRPQASGSTLDQARQPESNAPQATVPKTDTSVDVSAYTSPFLAFLTSHPTVYHAVEAISSRLESHGFTKLSERDSWVVKLERGGKYFFERNGSGMIAFTVGGNYKSGNGAAIVASHVDALTAKLKPISKKPTSAGYVQLGVAPYAGALNQTWMDRDLGIGGRVLIKNSKTGKIDIKLVQLGWPVARIPTLAPHFGIPAEGQANKETRMVPVIGLDDSKPSGHHSTQEDGWKPSLVSGGEDNVTFTTTQAPGLVKAIASELAIEDTSTIVNWELELFDLQPAQLGGLNKEFIFGGRIDDRLCAYAAIEALVASSSPQSSTSHESGGGKDDDDDGSGILKIVGLFDDEEIGSQLRQGAKSNFLPTAIERIVEAFAGTKYGSNVLSQTYANSFLISADVTHAVNPNYLGSYLEDHSPRLNTGIVIQADSNGHMTTDSISTALLHEIASRSNSTLQVFQIRNDSRSGGTVGPMLSSITGIRAIDAGLPQLSMHSIRATTGSKDPGIGVRLFKGFFDHYEAVDGDFR